MARFVIASALVLVLGLALLAKSEVITLTEATFDDKVKEPDTVWFIKFYAPWCGHCKRLVPVWDELGKSIEDNDGVEVAKVDCTKDKPVCDKAGVSAYPTLKIFHNGEELKKYSGPRDVESLKKFAVDAAADLATSKSTDTDAL